MVWDPNVCVPKMAPPDFPNGEFHFFPRWSLTPLLILTICGSEYVLVVSTEPLDDLCCFTTRGVGCPRDGRLPVPLTRCTL